MSVSFIDMTPADADQTGEVIAVIDPWKRLGFTAQILSQYLQRPDPSLYRYSIFSEGRLIGALALRYPWLRGPYLELLAIFPAFQKQGIGSQALNWAIESHRKTGARNFWACVSDFNAPARAFYADMGFVEAGLLSDLVQPSADEILLRKIL